jgi:hypothetical protein
MKKLTLFIALFFSLLNYLQAQELYYLEENFETSETRSRWYNDPVIPNKEWEYTYGGQWELGSLPYNPEIPKQGNYNAGIFYESLYLDTVKLVSPQLELGSAKKPTLRFWHCQYAKSVKGPDNLRLFFRVGPNSEWNLIHSWESDISDWKDEIFDIEDIDEKYLTDSFQLAFEGIIGNGYGVYIDSVTVKEDTIVNKFVKNTTYNSVEYEAIPGGATDIPLQEVIIRILGNTGDALLKTFTVVPSGGGINHLVPDSFKLYYTNNDVFAPFKADTSTLVAKASLSSGKVTFSNINQYMGLGDNHYWIAASFDNSFQGQTSVKFSIPADGIQVNDTLFPANSKTFTRTHIIKESAFYDNFDTGPTSWTLENNFEIGWPEGTQVSSQKNPSTPFNGQNILATDLDGAYLPNIEAGMEYYAYTPELDLTYYTGVELYMHTYFSINGPDDAVIEYSLDGGSNWINIWNSSPSSNNAYWSEFFDDSFSDAAKRQPQFQLRFGITGSESTPWPGISVDNFAIIGEKLNTDVGVTQILHPYNDCIGCGNDTIRAWFRNYADGPAPDTIPVYFGLDGPGSTLVYDTIFGGIAKDDSVLFTFSMQANFPQGDYYDNFIVGVDLSGDQDPLNDTLTKSLIIQKNITPDHFEDFEYKGGIWLPGEGSTWDNLDMTGTITTDPQSPNIWVLSPTGNYFNEDTTFVKSGCYNLSNDIRNVVEFKYWSETEEGKDGARFEYSIDDGNSWSMLEDPVHDTLWNWTIDTVEALSSSGWSGLHEWTTVRALIPETVDSESKVRFRILFMSDASTSFPQGFAFNDLSVYKAPKDVGVSTIDIPKDTCQFDYPGEINLWVKNYGYNTIPEDDTMILGYDFESDPAVIDTFLVASDILPGDSALFTVPTTYSVTTPSTYQLKAYTLSDDIPFFYGTNNDTTIKFFETWPNPITGLVDTISSRQPDTVVIRPNIEPEYTYLWGDNSTGNTYDVEDPGMYYLTITETNHGCQTEDSIYIELLFNDVGIDSIIWPQSSCELSAAENIQVQIHNFGTDSLIIDDKIYLYYELNGGPTVKDSLTLDASLYSGSSRWYTFENTTEDFSTPDDYSIKAYTDYGGDTIPENDTVYSMITVYGYPELDIGNDTVIEALDYYLDVDPGFETYLWNDGLTDPSRLIDSSGLYWLYITDENGCPATDSIDIWFKIRDVQPLTMTSPVSSCNRLSTDPVTVQIENFGTDTITTSDLITLGYSINENTPVTENISIELLPGEQYIYVFDDPVDLTEFGNYEFSITAITAKDLRTNNDTIYAEVITNSNPEIDLGIDPQQVYYETQLVLDAGEGENWDYLWHDGSTNRTYTVTNRGEVAVLVTDTETGCYGGDTVFVNLDILDYMVTAIDLDATSCSGPYRDVEVSILNNGNLVRQGANITLDYYMNNTFVFTENFEYNQLWQAGATRTHITDNTINLNTTGEVNFKVEITTTGDLRPENDSYTKALNVLQSPEVDFGGEELHVDFPYTLDAGEGHAEYHWSNGSTESTLTATEPGTYTVTVTGTNGCETIESVYLTVQTGIGNLTEDLLDLNIYPNPANEFVRLELQFNEPDIYVLEIFNTQNTIYFTREITELEYAETIPIGDLPKGLYFIRIRNKEKYFLDKLIVY